MVEVRRLGPTENPAVEAYGLVERGAPSLATLDPAPMFRVRVESDATDEQLFDAIEQAALLASQHRAAVIYVRDVFFVETAGVSSRPCC